VLVLVLNCGSSSVKFQVIDMDRAERRVARGAVERIGKDAQASFEVESGDAVRGPVAAPDHEAAVRHVIERIRSRKLEVGAVGHRVVHGGPRFSASALIDASVVAAIEATEELAPLHDAPSLAAIGAARAALGPDLPMVAVFDTAFHATIPEHAATYAIPHDLARRHGIRRYGFHGTSYRYVVARYRELTRTPAEQADLVAFHLGNGCSAAAIRGGRSLDTSMGLTPLEGLVMGTRSGDIDPAIVGFLARKLGGSLEETERLLNQESGLKGISGRSRDMRDLLAAEAGDPRARLAVDVFCHRARKYLGAYLAVLGGARAVVFTGGIGERSAEIRARICDGMEWCGLLIDPARNRSLAGEGEFGAAASRIATWVIPTDEELLIARDTVACLNRGSG
jgi:acetate kinase